MTDLTSKTDEELAVLSIDNMDAFTALIGRYEQRLSRYIQAIGAKNPEDAEEIVQDVFLKCWKHLKGFDPTLKFSSWVYRIAHNETRSMFRKWKSRGGEHVITVDPDDLTHISGNLDIDTSLGTKELRGQIEATLAAMPAKYSEVLFLRYFEDRSYEEIGDILRKPGGTVATLVSRAKKSFKDTYLTLYPNA